MKCQLTDKKIASLKADTKRLDVRDTLLTGFGIRVTPKGLKTFFVVYRANGKQKREKTRDNTRNTYSRCHKNLRLL